MVALGSVLALVAIAVAVPFFVNRQIIAVEETSDAPQWFGGYFDVTAAQRSDTPGAPSGTDSTVVLAFVVAESDDSCTPSWGAAYGLSEAERSLDLDRRIAHMRSDGFRIAVSFGGALNSELATACTDVELLADAYRAVIDRYGIATIDLDIEGENLTDSAANLRRAEAIAMIQEERRDAGSRLDVWLTLPVATTGLTEHGLSLIEQMLMNDVELAGVNAMTMDFGVDLDGQSMAEASIDALTSTEKQVRRLLVRHDVALPGGTAWTLLGATPMIGQNDVREEVFSLKDAERINRFALEHHLGRVSMWSLNRDRTCGPNYPNTMIVSDSCSGIDQGIESFAQLLSAGLGDSSIPEEQVSERPDPIIEDDPATAPYPIWSPRTAYSANVRVVWQGNVYASRWWTRGGAEPNDPTLSASESAWTLIGPVLRDDLPWALPTAPAGTYPEWDAQTVYREGDRVLFQGTPYEAKWWTQGDEPSIGINDHDRSPWEVVMPEDSTSSDANQESASSVAPGA